MQNPTIFVSYSHEDEVEKNQLVTQLSVLQQSDIDIDLWVDDRISAGQDWAEAIDNAMGRAVAAIFLVTANFLTSNFITHTEAPKILARHRQEGMPVFPLIGKHCAWKTVPWLADLNIKPKSKRPVWQTQGVPADDELATLVSEIYEVLKHSGGSIEPPQQKSVSAYLADTLVYLDNFGAVSQDIPPEPQAYHLDWTAYFNSRTRPRQVPAPTTWTDRLIPQLINLQQKIAAPSLVHLRGSASLPAGFAFGQSFLEVGRYQLQIDQFSNGIVQPWYSDVYKADTTFAERLLPGNSISKEAAVIIFANPKQNVEAVVQDVNHYLAQANVSFQQALLLEAEAASKEKRGLTNGEAMALAVASAERVGRLAKQGPFEKIHLFMAVPLGLAVFMGHQWNIINSTVQCYEWVGGSDIYAPAGLFQL